MIHKRKILALFILSSLILSVVQIVFSASFTTAGIDLNQLQSKKKDVEKQNLLIGEILYSQSSFTAIAKEAASDGFVDNKKAFEDVNTPQAVAFNQ